MEPGGSGPIPKSQNKALTDNVRLQITRIPPYLDPQGLNILIHQKKFKPSRYMMKRNQVAQDPAQRPNNRHQQITIGSISPELPKTWAHREITP